MSLTILLMVDGPAVAALLLALTFGDAETGRGSLRDVRYVQRRRRRRPGRHARLGSTR
ncbi:MAG TPA: hypothetical protein VFB25_10765 [Gaiellaceae bacterium]|nr:hypothetical protein [Gaiellaceae bacterium]